MRVPLPTLRWLLGLLLLAGGISAARAAPVTITVYHLSGNDAEGLAARLSPGQRAPTLEQLEATGNPSWSWTAELASGSTVSLQYASAGRRISITFYPEQSGNSWSLDFQFREEADQPPAPPAAQGANSRVTLDEGESVIVGGFQSTETANGESRRKAYYVVLSLE